MAASFALAFPACAQDGEVITGPIPAWALDVEPLAVPDDASGMVFMRRQQTQVHLAGDEQYTYNHSLLRLLHPNALQLGNIALTWNPAAGAPVVHVLRLHRGFNPPQRRQRESGQDQRAPYYNENGWSCYVTTVRIPNGTKRADWSFNSTFADLYYGRFYRRMFDQRDGAIRMVAISRVETDEVEPDRAERDNQRLSQFDNSMARITHIKGRNSSWLSEVRVPAADEVNWIEDYTACDPDYSD